MIDIDRIKASVTFGATLRRLRKAQGLSLGSLARIMGVTTVYLSRVELGKAAPLTFARTIEAARQIAVEPAALLRAHPTLGPAFVAGGGDERAAVVAFLADLAYSAGSRSDYWQGVGDGTGFAAQCIERGEHRKGGDDVP